MQLEGGWLDKERTSQSHEPSVPGEVNTHHVPALDICLPGRWESLCGLGSVAGQPQRGNRDPPPGRWTPRPCSLGGDSHPSLPRSTLSSQLKHAWGRGQPKGLPGGPQRCCRESSALPSPSRGRREEGRMAAERENWRRILNCSKMSGGLDAPPGPSPGEYQSPGWLS